MDRKRATVLTASNGPRTIDPSHDEHHPFDAFWGTLSVLNHRQLQGVWHGRTLPSLGLLCLVLVVAACSNGGKSSSAAKATPTSAASTATVTTPVATTPAGVQPTPVSGAYSLYVDPTYGYSFQYPSTWIVQPAIGNGESNVAMSEPQPAQTTPGFDVHPLTQLLVRATNNYSVTFVEHLLCGSSLSNDNKVAGYPTVNLFTGGGDPVNGYTAPAYGFAFFAKDKNLAFELWLQSDAKYTDQFFVVEKQNWQHLLATFNPGPGAKLVSDC
jgi:hypothetical protein